jgi:hypothetical protein
MVIGCYFIRAIGGYKWLLVPILLVVILLVHIHGYHIDGNWWLFY